MEDDFDEEEEVLEGLLNEGADEEENGEDSEGNNVNEEEEMDSPEDEDAVEDRNEGLLRRLHLRIRGRLDRDRVKKRPTKITYDPSLPTAHSYLGTDLEEFSGRTVLDEDSFVSLPLLHLPGVILVPGQTLPLHLFNQRIIAMMKHVLQNNRTFGVVHNGSDRTPENAEDKSVVIGTTAEIFSAKEEEESGIETMRVKAMGRQRFQVMETRRQVDGILIGTVRIIMEPDLPAALEGALLSSRNKLRLSPATLRPSESPEGDAAWLKQRRRRCLTAADWTWMPAWVYEMYDAEILILHIKAELKSWYEGSVKFHTVPSGASDFSFWVASNLPLNDKQRLKLLEINCPVQRLRLELDILRKCTMLNCTDCGLDIANKSDVFSMSLDGPMAAYVNPAGYVHDTLTVYSAHNLNLVGRPSQENSWFPGYAWTILQCRRCTNHMGWKFTAAKRKLKPEMFWGLTRSAVQPGFKEATTESELPLI